MKKFFSLLTAGALTLSLLAPLGGQQNVNAATTDGYQTDRYGDVLDIRSQLNKLSQDEAFLQQSEASIKEQAAQLFDGELANEGSEASSDFTYDGGTKYFLDGDLAFKEFTLRSVGETVEIWVANDLAFGEGDSRPAHIVTQEQVDKLKDEFDLNIYPVTTDFFGIPDSHKGDHSPLIDWGYFPEGYYESEDGSDKIIMLVDNIKDDNYDDPTYPFFVAGFFWTTLESYHDRNIITIDTNNWAERLENTFFGTTIHELQHLIHADNDGGEEIWLNEGMSDFAEYLGGYGHPWGHVNYFLDHPENSLVYWDEYKATGQAPETLADYGQAYLLTLYLYDKYGKEFIRNLAKDEDHGFASVDKILTDYNTGIDFNELFKRFSVALAVDSPEPGNGIYNFESIDVKVNYASAAANAKEGVPAWGADYIKVDDAKQIQNLSFDGIDFLINPTRWSSVTDPLGEAEQVLWAGAGDEIDNSLIFEADLTSVEQATLQFDNFIDIEEHWDFGIVQVSTDGGNTWGNLANENTTSDIVPEGYPAIKENLPGFTGYYDDWVNETFDLTDYAGQKVLVAFRYMTDWGYNDTGWYIDNIEIPEIGVSFNGTTVEPFTSLDELFPKEVKYAVSFVNEKSLGNGKNNQLYDVLNIDPFNVSEADSIKLKEFLSGGNNYMIVWYTAVDGEREPVIYNYEVQTKSEYNKNKEK